MLDDNLICHRGDRFITVLPAEYASVLSCVWGLPTKSARSRSLSPDGCSMCGVFVLFSFCKKMKIVSGENDRLNSWDSTFLCIDCTRYLYLSGVISPPPLEVAISPPPSWCTWIRTRRWTSVEKHQARVSDQTGIPLHTYWLTVSPGSPASYICIEMRADCASWRQHFRRRWTWNVNYK